MTTETGGRQCNASLLDVPRQFDCCWQFLYLTLLRITVSLVAEPARLGGSSLASLIPHSPPCLSNGNVQLCAKNAIQPSSYQWHYLSCPKSFMVWIGQQMELVMCWCLTCNLECKTDTALSPARKVCDVISSRYHDGRRE